ncbi:MAG: PHP domain-containing protein [Clostridia bacterium]|nr:PHP domain-containing protein [Clostridia bacterium]
MIRPDLHMHTTASDGIYNAEELARLVQRADVTLFSVTDHDTVAALPQAADAAYDRGLAFIPGIEISTEGADDVHILGYGVQHSDHALQLKVYEIAQERVHRVYAMADRLTKLGLALPMAEIAQDAGASIGRPHLARAMVKKGYVGSVDEAFAKYLGRGCPAYVPRVTMTATQAIRFLRERGAVPVLAHPGLLHWPTEKLIPMLNAWQDAGLLGLEVYHPANQDQYPYWDRLARQRRLLVTGGSDFHDGGSSHGQIGETAAHWPSALEDAWALYQAARR